MAKSTYNDVTNHGDVDKQVIVGQNSGTINVVKKTRFQKRFEKLNEEVLKEDRYEGVLEEFKYYITEQDSIGMEQKLSDCGFSEGDIFKASVKKQKYSKKQLKNRFYESAQWIDTQLFAKIKIDFETYIEGPLIKKKAPKEEVLIAVVEKVITPTLHLINEEGESDEVLNYSKEDIFGMVYYLTGRCHLNWVDYDNV